VKKQEHQIHFSLPRTENNKNKNQPEVPFPVPFFIYFIFPGKICRTPNSNSTVEVVCGESSGDEI
jgi:hypothetical protein